MMLNKNNIEKFYKIIYNLFYRIEDILKPYIRRLIRFIAIPYYYAYGINWKECKKNKYKVIYDLYYIFFVLKYYPDNYSLCRLWEVQKIYWKYYYGSCYDPYQRMKLERNLLDKKYSIIFTDKDVCYQICKSGQFPLPYQFCIINPGDNTTETFTKIFLSNDIDKIIIKPVLGSGGKGISIAYKKIDKIYVKDKLSETPLEKWVCNHRSVVQEYQKPHQIFSKISSAFTTIRVVTLLTNESNVLIIGAFIKFGVDNAFVDNLSSGGIAVGVNIDSGLLKTQGRDFESKCYYTHPSSHVTFDKIKIPFWSETIELSKRIQKYFYYYRLLGLDIGITQNGPILIEINPFYDNVALEQNYGPILINPDVLNAFKSYDLLTHNLL